MIIPFIYNNHNREKAEGVSISLIGNTNYIMESSGKECRHTDCTGLQIAIGANSFRNFSGLEIAALCNANDSTNGIAIGGINWTDSFNGVSIGGINCTDLFKGVSLGLINRAKGNNGFAVQIGAMNIIKEYDGESRVLQIGVYNRVGNRSSPFINFYNPKN